MQQSQPTNRKVGLAGLDAYRVALDFYREARHLVGGNSTVRASVRDQLLRAGESVVLNIAEAHPAVGPDRARRFRVEADEASECGAALDLVEIGGVTPEALAPLRLLLDRERAMLWRLSRPR